MRRICSVGRASSLVGRTSFVECIVCVVRKLRVLLLDGVSMVRGR